MLYVTGVFWMLQLCQHFPDLFKKPWDVYLSPALILLHLSLAAWS